MQFNAHISEEYQEKEVERRKNLNQQNMDVGKSFIHTKWRNNVSKEVQTPHIDYCEDAFKMAGWTNLRT